MEVDGGVKLGNVLEEGGIVMLEDRGERQEKFRDHLAFRSTSEIRRILNLQINLKSLHISKPCIVIFF